MGEALLVGVESAASLRMVSYAHYSCALLAKQADMARWLNLRGSQSAAAAAATRLITRQSAVWASQREMEPEALALRLPSTLSWSPFGFAARLQHPPGPERAVLRLHAAHAVAACPQ